VACQWLRSNEVASRWWRKSYPKVTPLPAENEPKMNREFSKSVKRFYVSFRGSISYNRDYMNDYHRWWEPQPQPTGGWGFHFNCGRFSPINRLRDSAWWSWQSWVCCCFFVSYPRHGFEFCCFRFWTPNKRAILIAPKNGHFVATFFLGDKKQGTLTSASATLPSREVWRPLVLRSTSTRTSSTTQDRSVPWEHRAGRFRGLKMFVKDYNSLISFSGRVKDNLPNVVVPELWVSCKVVPWTFCDIFWRNLIFYHLSSVKLLYALIWWSRSKSSQKIGELFHFWWWRSPWETTRCFFHVPWQVAATSITPSGVEEVPRHGPHEFYERKVISKIVDLACWHVTSLEALESS